MAIGSATPKRRGRHDVALQGADAVALEQRFHAL